TGEMHGSSAPFSYTQSATAHFNVFGSQIASPTMSTCNSKATCADINSSISKTLFSDSKTFWVAFVPVKVSASFNANLCANAHSEGYGQPFIGRQGYFMGNPRSSLSTGASVSATLSALAGIEDVLAVGVTGNFGIIGVSPGPVASELVLAYPGHGAVNW